MSPASTRIAPVNIFPLAGLFQEYHPNNLFKKRRFLIKAVLLNAFDSISIERAAQIIKMGGLAAFPTETVYGLGADVFNAVSVAKIFEVKKRPSFDPLIVHVCRKEDASLLWKETPPLAEKLMKQFWPGPLTIVLERKDTVPDIVTAGLSTVAVRMPNNKIALKLIELAGTPIAAPSANLYGYTSPTTAQSVADDLGDAIEVILDGGPASIGIESTVVKLEKDEIIILRPGGVTLEELNKISKTRVLNDKEAAAFESPGQMLSHYAPWTFFILMDKSLEKLEEELKERRKLFGTESKPWPRIGLLCFGPKKESPLFESVEVLSPQRDLVQAATNLFQAIRKLDKMHLDLIVAEPVAEAGIGLGIMDRLKKASGGKTRLEEFFDDRYK